MNWELFYIKKTIFCYFYQKLKKLSCKTCHEWIIVSECLTTRGNRRCPIFYQLQSRMRNNAYHLKIMIQFQQLNSLTRCWMEFLKDRTLCRHLCYRTPSTQQIATQLTFFILCSITQQSPVEHLTWTSLSCPMTQNAPKCNIESTHRGTFNLLNSIFVSFSITTREYLRELKFIFFFKLNIFSTLLKLNIQHSYYWVQAITRTTFLCS